MATRNEVEQFLNQFKVKLKVISKNCFYVILVMF